MRSSELSRLVRGVQRSINAEYINKDVEALLTESNGRSINGKTDLYKQVVLPGQERNIISLGSRVKAHIYAVSANALYGSVKGMGGA